jgi:hypothetical protein
MQKDHFEGVSERRRGNGDSTGGEEDQSMLLIYVWR